MKIQKRWNTAANIVIITSKTNNYFHKKKTLSFTNGNYNIESEARNSYIFLKEMKKVINTMACSIHFKVALV